DVAVGRTGGEEGPQGLTLPEVGQTRDRSPLLGELLGRDPALERHADVGQSAGPGAARSDGQADPVQIPGRGPALLIGDLGREPHSGTVVTAAAGARIGVVELTDEELHPALAGCFVV